MNIYQAQVNTAAIYPSDVFSDDSPKTFLESLSHSMAILFVTVKNIASKYNMQLVIVFTLAATAYMCKWIYKTSTPKRKRIIPEYCERVLILGASSGIGATFARKYAARGAAVCLVGRNAERLDIVARDCRVLTSKFRWKDCKGSEQQKDVPVLEWVADVTDIMQMISLQSQLCQRTFFQR